jgi:acyl dehydratase
MSVPLTYFEDVDIGDAEVTPAMTVTEAHAALYEGLAHHDRDAAGVVPDLLPLCLATGLGWRMSRPPLAVLAFMSVDWKIYRRLRIGDTIHLRTQVAMKRSMREGGVLIQEQSVLDQHGEVAQSGRVTFLVAKRDAAGARGPAAAG